MGDPARGVDERMSFGAERVVGPAAVVGELAGVVERHEDDDEAAQDIDEGDAVACRGGGHGGGPIGAGCLCAGASSRGR